MRIFEQFPQDKKCPICKTNEDKECVLIPIDRTFRGGLAEGAPTHADCLMKSLIYYPGHGIIIAREKIKEVP